MEEQRESLCSATAAGSTNKLKTAKYIMCAKWNRNRFIGVNERDAHEKWELNKQMEGRIQTERN